MYLSDVNLGIFTADLDQEKSIFVTSDKVAVRHHSYEQVGFADFMEGLLAADINRRPETVVPQAETLDPCRPEQGRPVTVRYLFQRLNEFLTDSTVVIADPGDAMFGAIDMQIRQATEFLSPAYYTSLGFAVPAALGAQLAKPELRPLAVSYTHLTLPTKRIV